MVLKIITIICILFLSLSCCLDNFNDEVNTINNNHNNTNNIKNNTINNNNKNNIIINNMSNNISVNMSAEYNIVKFGTHGNDKPSYSIIADNKYNKTTIYIYAGKKPSSDYKIKISKIIKDNNNNLIIYMNETQPNNPDMIITSPYVVVRVSGIYNNVNIVFK
ncbi:protease complex subunit PrcB family protein [Methanococcus aeolicus]|nr:protease complex subunit PrcB family protein [Methanococcus aeolicus]UXM84714.1 protease complex subunit PrcB family protein [Methanococcus aeolicus]